MQFDPKIEKGDILTNADIVNKFKCGNMGGMRRSKKTGTLVIISDKTKGLYHDVWKDNVLHYTGMGKVGEQTLKGNQNKTLYESNHNNVKVHLFEVEYSNRYVYKGEVKLVSEPYREIQKDDIGNNRRVWMFPLKVIDRRLDIIEKQKDVELIEEFSNIDKSAIPVDYVYIPTPKEKQEAIIVNDIKTYNRNKQTALRALSYANFVCEINKNHPTFIRKNIDIKYTEPHHLIPLKYSEQFTVSLDVESNIVSLCSNCHNEIHYGKDFHLILQKLYENRKKLLEKTGIFISYKDLEKMYL